MTADPFQIIYAALCGETWTEEKPEWGPDWHRQFPDWKAAMAARIAVEALEQAGALIDGGVCE